MGFYISMYIFDGKFKWFILYVIYVKLDREIIDYLVKLIYRMINIFIEWIDN